MSYLSYSKFRPFIIGFLVLGVIYNVYFFFQNSRLEKENTVSHVVIEQYCRYSKGSSLVQINYNGKVYDVRMANQECLKFPKGSMIYLVYNDRYDYFYQPDGLRKDSFRLFFFSFLLLLAIIPWNRLFRSDSTSCEGNF